MNKLKYYDKVNTTRRDGFYELAAGWRLYLAEKSYGKWELYTWDSDAPREDRLIGRFDTLRDAKEEAAWHAGIEVPS